MLTLQVYDCVHTELSSAALDAHCLIDIYKCLKAEALAMDKSFDVEPRIGNIKISKNVIRLVVNTIHACTIRVQAKLYMYIPGMAYTYVYSAVPSKTCPRSLRALVTLLCATVVLLRAIVTLYTESRG